MNYCEKENKIIITDFDSFDIEQILECGQCFRFNRLSEREYVIIAMGKVLKIIQKNDEIEFLPCTKDEFENIWIDYFDLDRDYTEIKNILSDSDSVLKAAVDFAPGIRILRQDPWECLISFIISQNNRIPMIKQVIKNISEKFGEPIGDYYAFPAPESLKNASYEQLMECKTGFRAKYIADAVKKICGKDIELDIIKELSSEEAKKRLMEIKGVGEKVSDCVMLFSMDKKEVFPTDVWIKRVIEHFYFEGKEMRIKDIHAFAKEKFGEYAGFAQQYLFYYARENKIRAIPHN